MNIFTSWKYYLIFLWAVAIIFAAYIVIGDIHVSRAAERDPALGMAMIGIVMYTFYLVLFIGFILLNYLIRKILARKPKLSKRYLITTWIIIAITLLVTAVDTIHGNYIQARYEREYIHYQAFPAFDSNSY